VTAAETVELGAALEAAAAAMTQTATAQGARIVCRAPADAAFVRAAADEIEAMCTGFIANAVRHAGAGGVVWAGIDTAADAYLLRVEDSGPGLPGDFAFPDVRETDRPPEAGLSLAQARAVLAALGGRLALQNRPEGGLRVLAFFPRAD
jgi:two-component system sensor histidine kinase QseC